MECIICGNPILGRRSDSKYCSTACTNTAKHMRGAKKYLNELNGLYPVTDINQKKSLDMNSNTSEELRTVEKENFSQILNLRTEYGDKIRSLEEINLRNEFKIEKLEDKIQELKEKHLKDLADASKSATKDTVNAITQMPVVQTTLGMLANTLIPRKPNALGGVEDEFSIQERQIIDAIRRMQPDAQGYLVQMLYVLFAKPYEEQMQIFNSLQVYLSQAQDTDDDI